MPIGTEFMRVLHELSSILTDHLQPECLAMGRQPGARAVDDQLHGNIKRGVTSADQSAARHLLFGEGEGKEGNALAFFRHLKIGRRKHRIHFGFDAATPVPDTMRLEDCM